MCTRNHVLTVLSVATEERTTCITLIHQGHVQGSFCTIDSKQA